MTYNSDFKGYYTLRSLITSFNFKIQLRALAKSDFLTLNNLLDRIDGFEVHIGDQGNELDPVCGALQNKDFIKGSRHIKCELSGR